MSTSLSSLSTQTPLAVTDVYTDVQGLQQLGKNGDKDEALKKVAQQFESMFINMMLKNMRKANAVFEEDSLFNSKESHFYRDMHDHQLSLTLSHKKGLGIADMLYRQMSRSYGDSINTDQQAREKKAERVSIANSPSEFVDKVMPAIRKAAKALGVDADMLTAQAALETGWGKYMLANKDGEASNNLFNIKRDAAWKGDTVSVSSLEEKGGVLEAEQSEFKAYNTIGESVSDYIAFLKGNSRYTKALESAENGFEFIRNLQRAGYATDSNYAEKIFSVYKHITQKGGLNP